ncbi:hypothetical protein [Halorarum salinum]|uniref:DUF8142 domain-containing protein n=1 Tax=Halorarum salinum TaxID=2743089 RepID=A0A7D5LB54_9EURY|nr:hypothetical protein [Halobaculum salinum]QLG62350.1 hypothetical protein HUG12_11660 [Halobaculum salinum]
MVTTPDGGAAADADGAAGAGRDGPREPPAGVDGNRPDEAGTRNRKRGVLSTLPFLAIGLADVILLLRWGIEPLWGFAILPPILFCSVLAYLVFSTDFLEGRT